MKKEQRKIRRNGDSRKNRRLWGPENVGKREFQRGGSSLQSNFFQRAKQG